MIRLLKSSSSQQRYFRSLALFCLLVVVEERMCFTKIIGACNNSCAIAGVLTYERKPLCVDGGRLRLQWFRCINSYDTGSVVIVAVLVVATTTLPINLSLTEELKHHSRWNENSKCTKKLCCFSYAIPPIQFFLQ